MSEQRTVTRLSLRNGDRLLQNLSARLDLSIYDDKHEVSTGLLNFSLPNTTGLNSRTIDFTSLGLSEVKELVIWATKEIDYQINASGDTYKLVPPTDLPTGQNIDERVVQAGLLVMITSGITSILFTNNSSGETDIRYFAAGDK